MSIEEKRRTLGHTFSSLLKSSVTSGTIGLGVAQLICPPAMLQKASMIADSAFAISKIHLSSQVVCYSVRAGSGRDEYIVVPGKFCSCPFYKEQILKSVRTPHWMCKHDLAVQLRVAMRPGDIPTCPKGRDLLIKHITSFN